MCYEFDWAYQQRRAEEARRELARREEERRAKEQKPKEPVPAPKGETGALPAKATLIVELPADANLYIDDRLMKSPSDKRTLTIPLSQTGDGSLEFAQISTSSPFVSRV